MIDRGFIKWQPFNSVISNKTILNNLNQQKEIKKPVLFPEEMANIEDALTNAYYAKNLITIIYYENNLFKKITTTIVNLNPTFKTLKLASGKILSFNQIIHILE